MNLYRLRIQPKSAFITPWLADTFFGHICWAIKQTSGDDELKAFLAGYRSSTPPVLFSDGFPGDLLPSPICLGDIEYIKSLGLPQDYDTIHTLKKIKWLPMEVFNKLLAKEAISIDEIQSAVNPYLYALQYHNQIDRTTGSTSGSGMLYEMEEVYFDISTYEYISIYIKANDEWHNRIKSFIEIVSYSGYGKKKSSGKGAFDIIDFDRFNGFQNVDEANGFVSLSNFVPSSDDPIDGFYRLFIKYGKLGEEFAYSSMPFKKPLIMLTAGSVLKDESKKKEYYGTLIEGLASAKPEVVHYGYAFALPMKI